MTVPRRILKNVTYLLTRRCLGRRFLLTPSKRINGLFTYLLASAAERYGVILHAICVLSDHYHCVITDPQGKLPLFSQYLDSLLARSLNALHGRWESFWAPGSYSAVTLLTPRDVVEKIAYVLANPASAGLVQHGSHWPGVWSSPEQIGGAALEVTRPGEFFREQGPLPPTVKLRFACPVGFASLEQFRSDLVGALSELEEEAARRLVKAGRWFRGVRRVLRQRPHERALSKEPRRGLRPRLASRDPWKRLEAIGRLKKFLREYRRAWLEFARGAREAIFPAGTYWMRVAHGVRCAAAG
jgi:REP element-mobilizing transposase RayT